MSELSGLGKHFKFSAPKNTKVDTKISLTAQAVNKVAQLKFPILHAFFQRVAINIELAAKAISDLFFPDKTFDTIQNLVNSPTPEAYQVMVSEAEFMADSGGTRTQLLKATGKTESREAKLTIEGGGQCHGATLSSLYLYHQNKPSAARGQGNAIEVIQSALSKGVPLEMCLVQSLHNQIFDTGRRRSLNIDTATQSEALALGLKAERLTEFNSNTNTRTGQLDALSNKDGTYTVKIPGKNESDDGHEIAMIIQAEESGPSQIEQVVYFVDVDRAIHRLNPKSTISEGLDKVVKRTNPEGIKADGLVIYSITQGKSAST